MWHVPSSQLCQLIIIPVPGHLGGYTSRKNAATIHSPRSPFVSADPKRHPLPVVVYLPNYNTYVAPVPGVLKSLWIIKSSGNPTQYTGGPHQFFEKTLDARYMINFIDRTAIAKLQMAHPQINTRLDSDFGYFHLPHPPTFNSKLQLQLQYSTMETTRKELRTLTIPHGVHKSSNNCNSPSRNAAFQACQACYARKKRCVTSPSHHQCTYCFREGQRCLPRERPVR